MVSKLQMTCDILIGTVLARMIRTIVLNDTNFKSIIHHVHKLKEMRCDHSGEKKQKCAKHEQSRICMQGTRRSVEEQADERGECILDREGCRHSDMAEHKR